MVSVSACKEVLLLYALNPKGQCSVPQASTINARWSYVQCLLSGKAILGGVSERDAVRAHF